MLSIRLSFSLACLILHTSVALSQIFEFCADNQLFSFSKEECPGGVLFKSPMELTEPCHCVNKHLTAYSTCDFDLQVKNHSNNPMKVCRLFYNSHKRHENVLVRLLQPATRTARQELVKLRHKDSKCRNLRRKCKRIASNSHHPLISASPSGTTPEHTLEIRNQFRNRTHAHKFRRGRAHHRQKRDASKATDGKLRERIQETMDLLYDLQFGSVTIVTPRSMSFQLLLKTVTIFNSITPSVIVEDEVVNSILALFLKKYADMELPGYSGRLTVDDLVDRKMFENVMGSLQECASRASDSSQEFEFVTTNACPPNITHVVHKVSTLESGFKRVRYELGTFMPVDRKYVPEKEDFVLAALWKVFDAAYSYCFSSVFSYRTSQTLNNYFTIISNIFTSPWTVNDYISDIGQGTQMYSSRIEHENLKILMKNLDYMTEAVHMLSRYKTFFNKPVPTSTAGDRPKREHGPDMVTLKPTTTSESPIFRNRNKRSIRNDRSGISNWVDLEIWDGRAYCLQISNPNYPPSIANVLPRIEDLCAST